MSDNNNVDNTNNNVDNTNNNVDNTNNSIDNTNFSIDNTNSSIININNNNMETVFTNIYLNCVWGDNKNSNYSGSSGIGSTLEYNSQYIPFIKSFIANYETNVVVDLGCGDFICGPDIYKDNGVIYYGLDVYKELILYHNKPENFIRYNINFKHIDFYTNMNAIPHGDLCIIKDVLQHWSNKCIYELLDFIINSRRFKYILIINCCNQEYDNYDIINGDYRHLSCDFFPLKKYNPIKLLKYNSKEISLISL